MGRVVVRLLFQRHRRIRNQQRHAPVLEARERAGGGRRQDAVSGWMLGEAEQAALPDVVRRGDCYRQGFEGQIVDEQRRWLGIRPQVSAKHRDSRSFPPLHPRGKTFSTCGRSVMSNR